MNLLLTVVDALVLLVLLLTTFECLRQVHSFKQFWEAVALGLTCWGAFVGLLYYASHPPHLWQLLFHSGVALQAGLRYYHRYKRSVANVESARIVSISSAQVAARQTHHRHGAA